MSGIILFVVLAIWFYIVAKVSGFCVANMKKSYKKILVQLFLFILFFIAPVADEIIGGFQFRALCIPENLLVYDEEKLRDKSVKFQDMPSYSINSKAIPIHVTHGQWVNPISGEVLIIHKIFYAYQGWLSNFIGLSYSRKCDLREYYELFKKLNIIEIEN